MLIAAAYDDAGTARGRRGLLGCRAERSAAARPMRDGMTQHHAHEAPADGPAPSGRLVELSHVIRAGMATHPGLPAPTMSPFLTREASRARYAPGTEFAIDSI